MARTQPGGSAPDRPVATITLDRHDDIRAALFDPNLSRTFDRRSWSEGNIRDGVVSTTHGATHRARRRIENSQFRPDRLREYERDLFPAILDHMLDRLIVEGHADLYMAGELVSVVLAARRAGIDHDPDDIEQLRELVGYVDVFSQGAAILDAHDPEAVRSLYREAMHEFEVRWARPSWQARASLIERHRADRLSAEELPHDILTVLLLHREDPQLGLFDDGRVVREVATYLQGGTHTSGQTLVNAVDLLFPYAEAHPGTWGRIVDDAAFAQRCVQEALRLRPTTPRIRRRAESATRVGEHEIPQDALVILDALAANQDPDLFGERPDEFDPDRAVEPSVARWGLTFGAGPHQCPGRSVAGGFPAPPPNEPAGEDHLFGLVALMLAAVAARGVRPDPVRQPERDTRTERHTRWRHYPVRFGPPGGA
jgi:cytochrome P450